MDTALPSFETMFGAGIDRYSSSLVEGFQGYSIEGGFDNGLTWLRSKVNEVSGLKISCYGGGGADPWGQADTAIPPAFGLTTPACFPPLPLRTV